MRLPALQGLDADFSMAGVWKALQGMKTHRAPGGDGIPTDFYCTALKEKQCLEEWRKEQEAIQRAAGEVAGSTLGRRVGRQIRPKPVPAGPGMAEPGTTGTGMVEPGPTGPKKEPKMVEPGTAPPGLGHWSQLVDDATVP